MPFTFPTLDALQQTAYIFDLFMVGMVLWQVGLAIITWRARFSAVTRRGAPYTFQPQKKSEAKEGSLSR
jgi:hypothetical protein